MKTLLELESTADSSLVQLCLRGNRDAFAQVVARYQSVVCAIAYSACGDVGHSEDLAQETFVAAWLKLGELREPEKLRSWLCGIARNLVNNSVRSQQRVPTAQAGELSPETCSGGASPQEMAISNEEEALMWRALETMPPEYREPMVLYYREGQSAEKVAAALELTEEAVRQRLSRGRVMLNERVAKTVESALFRSGPGKIFTLAVLAALPAFAVSASAATVGSAAAKGSATAKAAASMGLAGILFGPLLAFFGTYVGYRLSLQTAHSAGARAFVLKFYRILGACIVLFCLVIGLVVKFGMPLAKSNPVLFSGIVIGIVAAYSVALLALVLWARRCSQAMDREEMSGGFMSIRQVQELPSEPLLEYRSKASLLGLPLIHVRFGGGRLARRKGVKAWIAAGDIAIGGMIAFGGVAIAPISFGGLGIGLVSFSGMAVGALSYGGMAAGIWAAGGTAVGLLAFGGCALGWKGAVGGFALAREYALGGAAVAGHANDAVAMALVQQSQFFPAAMFVTKYAMLVNLVWVVPLVLILLKLRKMQAAARPL